MTGLQVHGLEKRFPRTHTPAVRDASFDAPGGTITALIGPSGSGKTTVLRMLAGLENPDRGSLVLDGRNCTRLPARERQVGLVFQGYALFQHMSVRENIGFGLRVRGLPRARIARRVDELLELVGLGDLGARLPSQLSGGQQQRVAFARALAPEPRLLLLDEPFAALDSQTRTQLRAGLRELHGRTRLTTLLVTHDREDALALAEHLVVMREGCVVQVGAPSELFQQPAVPFVSAFLGEPAPCNP